MEGAFQLPPRVEGRKSRHLEKLTRNYRFFKSSGLCNVFPGGKIILCYGKSFPHLALPPPPPDTDEGQRGPKEEEEEEEEGVGCQLVLLVSPSTLRLFL